LSSSLTIAVLIDSPALAQSLQESLANERYRVKNFAVESDFLDFVEQEKYGIDCLIFQVHSRVLRIVDALYQHSIVLPAVFLQSLTTDTDRFACNEDEQPAAAVGADWPNFLYHASEVFVSAADLINISADIDQSIGRFLNLTPLQAPSVASKSPPEQKSAAFLLQQQRRLSEKLKARLGYLAVYYNRNRNNFFRQLSPTQRQDLSVQLKEQYRQIILAYFTPDSQLNDLLDQFVASVFFADLSVSEVVEIHMDLMDDFATQLKIEGWSEDILLDYRLTLIDVIAHLCEMYRRSIPAENQK
jgi:circadian clock protein KaiA